MNAGNVAVLRPPGRFASDPGESSSGERAELRMPTPPLNTFGNQPSADSLTPREAFDSALAEHREELLAYLCKRMGHRETAADLAQETFIRMMKYRDATDIEDRRLMLFRIANNLITEYYRTRRRHHASDHFPYDEMEPLQAEQPTVEAIIDTRNAIDILLKRTIRELPSKCRLAFMMSRFDGLNYPQIADRMGVSVKMVEKHITKALLACRAAVGDRDF